MEDHFDISDAFEISKFEIRGCTCIKIYEFLFSNPWWIKLCGDNFFDFQFGFQHTKALLKKGLL